MVLWLELVGFTVNQHSIDHIAPIIQTVNWMENNSRVKLQVGINVTGHIAPIIQSCELDAK